MQDFQSGQPGGPPPARRTKRTAKPSAQRALLAVATAGLVTMLGAVGAGCLSRPVQQGKPTTKTNFTAVVRQQAIDKVDLLFAIDNSASMGDKQELLRLAVPDLVNRLINPYCVADNNPNQILGASKNGVCDTGKPEFPPVHDMHIGIITSSLGGRGSDACPPDLKNPADPEPDPNKKLNAHNDDRGHLINRAGDREVPVPNAGSSNFLAWLPDVEANRGKDVPPGGVFRQTAVEQFNKDFQDLVSGVHEYGCGYEAQLESVYRFLIQPDPYDQVVRQGTRALLAGIDGTVLQQRRDFLRPDSLVSIIMITDENDSTVDPLSVAGQGWAFLNSAFPGSPNSHAARATSGCKQSLDPKNESCTSCGFKKNADGSENTKVTQDPDCQENGGYYQREQDDLNVRPIRMKERFGVDPQFPLSRYVRGLTESRVPNRNGEHRPTQSGFPEANYRGDANCTNPLFAAALPVLPPDGADENKLIDDTLCNLPPGPRTPDLVFFAVIGGVPWQLLATDPKATAENVVLKDRLEADDWVKIVGKDPELYDYSGQEIHMVESFSPRPGLPVPAAPGTADNGLDPYHGREWVPPNNGDLQFACTFELPTTDALPTGEKNCELAKFKNACDCTGKKNPPLCKVNPQAANQPSAAEPNANLTLQVRGKAYPTIREFAVVKALGDQGIISSICPIKVKDPTGNDPLFGYRPAVKAIVDRLKNALASQCLPQALTPDPSGEVSCLILEVLGPGAADLGQKACDDASAYPGRKQPDPAILAKFRESLRAEQRGDAGPGTSLADRPICQITQIPVPPGESCAEKAEAGWCYVKNAGDKTPAGSCPQAILFTATGGPRGGSRVSLQCIRATEQADDKPPAAPAP